MTEHHASKAKGLLWVLLGCFLGVAVALGFSPLAHIIPWSWETKAAKALSLDTPEQECNYSFEANDILGRLVKRIYPIEAEDKDFSISVKVARSNVVNAYANLGGNIVINSGLLLNAQSPEEVAGILAHEIEHVHRRHILAGLIMRLTTSQGMQLIFGANDPGSSWANLFLTMSFTKTQEAQADEGGLRRLQVAHIDNHGFINFFQRMGKSNIGETMLSDHPANEDRIAMARNFTNQDTTPIMSDKEWYILKNYCINP